MKKTLLIRIPPLVSEITSETTVQWAVFSSAGELLEDVHVAELGQVRALRQARQSEEGVPSEEPSEEASEEISDEVSEDVSKEAAEAVSSNSGELEENLVLLLPGNLTIGRCLSLNSGQRKHIHSALPYLVEEELTQDVDSIHITHAIHRKSDQVSLVALPHAVIQNILSVCDQSGLPVTSIHAECQLPEPPPETVLLILDSSMVIMATLGYMAQAIEYDALPFALEQRVAALEEKASLAGSEDDHRLSRVKMVFADGAMPTPENRLEFTRQCLAEQGWLVDEEPFNGSVFELFAQHYFAAQNSPLLLDLRQGPYLCPKKTSRRLRQWRPLIAIAACWLVLEVGLMVGQGFYFNYKANALWHQNADGYLRIFPQDRQVREAKQRGTRTFDLRQWMQNRLKSLDTPQKSEPFLPLLKKISVVASSQGDEADIVPQGMDFNDMSGQLVFEFQAANLETVNKFMEALRGEGLQTRLDSANKVKAGVIAKMTVARESRG